MGSFQDIQGKASLGACLLLALSLSACDTKTPIEPEGVAADIVTPASTVEAAAGVNSDSTSELAVQVNKTPNIDKEKPKKKLNLTLSDDVMVIAESGAATKIDVAENSLDESNALPNMFGEKQEGTTVGGGVLRDTENEDYVDSIQGAEVNVEFKID